MPDIDLDFARDIREQLILQVYERYGHEHAALVCSFATYHLRSAVRDLGKVLGLPAPAIDKLARLSEGGSASSVRRELATLPEFQGQAEGPMWAHLMDLAEQIDGFPRHVGQHVGGMIISSRPVVELVPVQPASMAGRYICQWDKDSCDDARFIKIDFLALGMLSLVEECLELIWQCRGEKLDVSTIAYDDTAVYDAICNGDTVGLFQIESRAQIQMLTRTQPRNLDDLAVQVAIVRPGPIVGGAVNPYVRRRELLREDPQLRAARRPSAAGRAVEGHARHRPVPGPGARSGHRDGRVYAGPGRPVPSVDESAALDARRWSASASSFVAGAVKKGVKPRAGGRCLRQAVRVFGVRLSQEPRLRVRGAGLSVGLAAALLRGRVLRGAAQQSADGLLCAARADRRRAAARAAGPARGDQQQRRALRAG